VLGAGAPAFAEPASAAAPVAAPTQTVTATAAAAIGPRASISQHHSIRCCRLDQ
jgi:hypothetical protein